MIYEVKLGGKADKFYAKASRSLAGKLARCFEQLEQTPTQHPNIKSLKGPFNGLLRYRVGDYRVIYRVDERAHRVMVLEIAHRGKVYE